MILGKRSSDLISVMQNPKLFQCCESLSALDVPLWVSIRTTIDNFMLGLFNQGAFQGTTPSQAFQVKCDATTTTPDDQANGIVNIVVGFAPLKPAEFVVIKLAQLAGQSQS